MRSKSHFLYGPRQTGESSMIRHELPDSVVYNLLDSQVFLALSQRLSRLREELVGIEQTVLIDKIEAPATP
ncbi:MAG TPA: hypothetical protein EYQ29_06665 [Candidatus Lambdaproteobacteria bacterium]|nr:hypothetical protein [Candidatus Lambdaproteobacteria bacterium]